MHDFQTLPRRGISTLCCSVELTHAKMKGRAAKVSNFVSNNILLVIGRREAVSPMIDVHRIVACLGI